MQVYPKVIFQGTVKSKEKPEIKAYEAKCFCVISFSLRR